MLFYPAPWCPYLETFLWLTQVKKVKANTWTQKLLREVALSEWKKHRLEVGRPGFWAQGCHVTACSRGQVSFPWSLCGVIWRGNSSCCLLYPTVFARGLLERRLQKLPWSVGFSYFKTPRFVFCLAVGQSQKYRGVWVAIRTAHSWMDLGPREGNWGGAERSGAF